MKTKSGTDSRVSFVMTPYVRWAIRSNTRLSYQWAPGTQKAMKPKTIPRPIRVKAVG
jgi:hypothetical protein